MKGKSAKRREHEIVSIGGWKGQVADDSIEEMNDEGDVRQSLADAKGIATQSGILTTIYNQNPKL